MSAENYFYASIERAKHRPTAEDRMVTLLGSIAYSLALIAEYIEKKDREEEEDE